LVVMKHKTDEPKGVALAQPVAETPLAKRMLSAMGEHDFRLIRTLQQIFGARVLHYQDPDGQVGVRPAWATDEDAP
jgi:hypothetical protein